MLAAIGYIWLAFLVLGVCCAPFAWAYEAYQSHKFSKWIKAKEAATEQRRMERIRANR